MSIFDSEDVLRQLIIAERPIIYNNVAASMLMFWDACILLSQEVEYIWWSKWSVTKFLYLFIRYLGIGSAIFEILVYTDVASIVKPTLATCYRWNIFQAAGGLALFFSLEIVFIMRVLAFYENSKRVLGTLVVLLICENVAHSVLLALSEPQFEITPNVMPLEGVLPTCIYLNLPKFFAHVWIPGLVFESILFSMVMYKFFSGFKSQCHIRRTFIRDGTWAFALIFAMLMWNNFTFTFAATKLGGIPLAWIYTAISICGTRVILNLRVAAHNNVVGSTWNTGVGNQLRFINNSDISTLLVAPENFELSKLDTCIVDSQTV